VRALEDTLATREGHNYNDDALVGLSVPITMTPDTISCGIEMAADRVIGVSVTPVSRVGVAGRITRAVSWVTVAITGPIAMVVPVSRIGIAVTGPIAVSRVAIAITGPIAITVSWIAVAVAVSVIWRGERASD
jgi:hypothetical protein